MPSSCRRAAPAGGGIVTHEWLMVETPTRYGLGRFPTKDGVRVAEIRYRYDVHMWVVDGDMNNQHMTLEQAYGWVRKNR